jgi:hypothetical protein
MSGSTSCRHQGHELYWVRDLCVWWHPPATDGPACCRGIRQRKSHSELNTPAIGRLLVGPNPLGAQAFRVTSEPCDHLTPQLEYRFARTFDNMVDAGQGAKGRGEFSHRFASCSKPTKLVLSLGVELGRLGGGQLASTAGLPRRGAAFAPKLEFEFGEGGHDRRYCTACGGGPIGPAGGPPPSKPPAGASGPTGARPTPSPGADSAGGGSASGGSAGRSGTPPVSGLMWTFQCSVPSGLWRSMSREFVPVDFAALRSPTLLPSGRSVHEPFAASWR